MLREKKAYICSPLSDQCEKQQLHNMEMARYYMGRMSELYHCRTFASHAYLPLMLDDRIPEERELALSIGKQLMELCGALIICGRRITSGMMGEIRFAFEHGKEVYWYDSEKTPFQLRTVHGWEEIKDAVQIPEKDISE